MADYEQEVQEEEETSLLSDTPSITGTMDQQQLEEQLAMVQEMVMEMKHGFTTVMDSLGKIQFGDQRLQKQMSENQSLCQSQIKQMTESVNSLKVEVQTLSTQLGSVSVNQKLLEEQLETYQIDRDDLLAELERCGAISEHMRAQYQGTITLPPDPSSNFPSTISPMVQPYLASLQQLRDDPCQSESSVTVLACKSLNLSQALHDRCLHLDLSASSDDDELRHAKNSDYHTMTSNTYYSDRGIGQKIPPHEKIREDVHRERAAQKIVESEQAYCSSLWTLIDGIINPIRQEEIMSVKDLNLIFPSYISQLYEQHCIILRKLEERLSNYKCSGIIGDVFAKLADTCDGDGLTLYKEYIGDFPAIVGNMNKWFAQSTKFRDIMKANKLSSCPVLHLLHAPLQQIPHYTLLIKELLKYTSEDHPDRYYLESSLSKLKNFIVIMNDELDHAVQLLSIKNINRIRETGTSLRSRSSGSSCDANQTSSARDSGILSNGEDNGNKMLASPNTTRKYLLQVAGKDYEQPSNQINKSLQIPDSHRQSYDKISAYMDRSLPIIRSHGVDYSNRPDVLRQRLYSQELQKKDCVNHHSTSRLQNSQTAHSLHSPHESDRPIKQIKFRQRPLNHMLGNNMSTHRSLTPSSFPLNSTPDSRNIQDGHVNSASRLHRPRPASAISFRQSEKRDTWADQIVKNVGLSPRLSKQGHSNGLSPRLSGGRREDLHQSLQKLLEERDRLDFDMGGVDYIEENPEEIDSSLAVGSSANIVRMQMNSNSSVSNSSKIENSYASEDYGVYGDNDDIANSVDMMYNGIKQSGDLSVDHNVTSSTSSGFHPSHERNESCSQEELAMSLAHSLSDGSTKFSNSSGQHSDIETSNLQPYELETLSNSKVHIVNMNPVQCGLNNSNHNYVHEQQVISHQKGRKQIDPNPTCSLTGGLSLGQDSVISDLRKYADSIHVGESNSSPPNRPDLGDSETLQLEQVEHLAELEDIQNIDSKPIFQKRASEKVSSRTSRLVQPHNRAFSAKRTSVTESEKKKVDRDRNSNLSPSRLPRLLSVSGNHENTPFQPRPDNFNSTINDNQRDSSTECSTSKYNQIESRIPQRRVSDMKIPADPISKSSEDLTKMRKKSAFKHSIKNFFGKKRKRAKVAEFSSSIDLSTTNHFFDPDFAVLPLEDQLDWHDNQKM